MRTSGDRRSRIRFEVFGAFWGTFDADDSARVLDLTRYGVLVEATRPLVVESIQRICLVVDGQPTMADARVRHLRATMTDHGARYFIGMEFVTASVAFADEVERLLTDGASNTERA